MLQNWGPSACARTSAVPVKSDTANSGVLNRISRRLQGKTHPTSCHLDEDDSQEVTGNWRCALFPGCTQDSRLNTTLERPAQEASP